MFELDRNHCFTQQGEIGGFMRFSIIGPLCVTDDDGRELRLPRGRVRQVLTVLLLHAAPVPEEKLCRLLSDGARPVAGSTLRTHITALRRSLGAQAAARVRTLPAGYLIEADPIEVDLRHFRLLYQGGRRACADGDHRRAVELLRQATGMWREPLLADVPRTTHLWPQVMEIAEEWRLASETLIDARLSLGEHRELIPELLARTTADPPQERPFEQLMTALYRSGRRAEACDAYLRLRRRLAESYGVEPGPAIEAVHQRILTGERTA
jgi:DNA-binding SARP family transcriptional activator